MNIVSLYKIVKGFGLMNTLWSVILVDVAINTPQAVFLFKEFIESTIPKELEEAAAIDGCSVFKRFFLIVLPLLKPVISTVVIIVTLNVWNEFMTPLLFLQSRENDVILQEVTRNIGQFATDWTALFPMLMLGVAPLMIFYVFMQKYIIAGVAAGAVKGKEKIKYESEDDESGYQKECNNVMVIVPHQDDEILMSAGVIRVCEQNNVPYTVVMVTNGDYGCIDYSKGYARLKESLAGLETLGSNKESFEIMGYADTGMPERESFLTHLYNEKNEQKNLSFILCTRNVRVRG